VPEGGVHVEVGPHFGPARTAKGDTGAAHEGAFIIEFDALWPMHPTHVGLRTTAIVPATAPLPITGANPRFVHVSWCKFWLR